MSQQSSLYKQSLPLLATPWLMLPPDVKDGPNGPTDNYFNILDKTIVKIDRQQFNQGNFPRNTICVGTTQGCVAFTSDTDNTVFLVHPYKQGCSFQLPPYHSVMYRTGFNCTLVGNPISNRFALLSLEDWEPDQSGFGVHIGNSSGWRKQASLRDTESLIACDVRTNIVYKLQWGKKSLVLRITCLNVLGGNVGGQSFEFNDPFVDGLGRNRRVLSSFMDKESGLVSSDFSFHESIKPWDRFIEKFLVVGEEPGKREPVLLLVIRYLVREEGVCSKTKGIHLIKIDLQRRKLEYVRSLGDQALFIGTNSDPFFVSTTKCRGLKSNSVYIADDLGVFDLATKRVTPFLSLGDLANIRPKVYWLASRSFH